MHAVLRQAGVEMQVDLDLEEEIRAGRISTEDAILYPPWTGNRFAKVRDIPAIQDLLDAVPARLRQRFDRPIVPWGTLGLAALLAAGAATQIHELGSLRIDGVPRAALDQLALGYESTLLGGAWWTVWTGHLAHDGVSHLALNLPILLYCAWRVERMLGATALAFVVAVAAACSSAAIALFSELPVVGSSTLAFGVWGAQIMLGLRLGDAVPARERGYYGWGNLVFFLPLWLAGLSSEGVSHLGHLAGLLGGGLAATIVTAATLVPRHEARHVSVKSAMNAASWLMGSAATALFVGATPDLSGFPWERVDVAETGVTLDLPQRLALHATEVAGMQAWTPSAEGRSGAFCGLSRRDEVLGGDERAAHWGRWFGGEARLMVPAQVLSNGWSRTRIDVDHGGESVEVVELDVLRGRTLLRCGYWRPQDGSPYGGDVALYDEIFARMDIGEPPALARARDRWVEMQDSPSRTWDFAVELTLVGAIGQADALLAGLDNRNDHWPVEAARARMALWREHPELPVRIDPTWLRRNIARADVADEAFILDVFDTLVRIGACDVARDAIEPRLPRPLRKQMLARVGTCTAGVPTVERL